MNKTLQISFAFLGLSLLAACSSETKEEKTVPPPPQKTDATVEEMSKEETALEETYNFVLPSPLQIAAIFQRAGLTYIPEITHDVSDKEKYNTEFKMALNFGVYSADLSYCVLNGQSQNSIDYLEAVKSLADKLGIQAIFEAEPLLENFNKNINNKDSVVYILSKIQHNLDLYLDENNTRYKSVIYFTGAWIEGMYLGAKSIDKRNRKELGNRLVEQLNLLDNLIKGLENYPKRTDEFDPLIAKLKDLRQEMEKVKDSGKVNEDGTINYTLPDEKLEVLTQSVEELRNYVINA